MHRQKVLKKTTTTKTNQNTTKQSKSFPLTRHKPSKVRTTTVSNQSRSLHIHEFQAKRLLRDNGITTTDCVLVEDTQEAYDIAKTMLSSGVKKIVVKSQVHAGGRGKGSFRETGFKGGVHLADSADKVKDLTQQMFGKHLVTKQTGKRGQKVSKILLEPAADVVEEKYLAILMDRKAKGPVIIISPEGGMNIEDVAKKNPNAVKKVHIDILNGISNEQAYEVVDFLGGSNESTREENMEQIKKLYTLFDKTDSTQVEINPLVVGKDHKFRCVDAKFNFDDNASFRQKDIWAMRDVSMENPRDVEAERHGLTYVELDGEIALMVNGAGLAMATLDTVQHYGAKAANFLDVGGGASKESIEAAFKLVLGDPQVRSIVVNIFGGIMKCDTIADGIIAAAGKLEIKVPVVVRLEGTNADLGKERLQGAGLGLIPAGSLDEAVTLAIKSAKEYEEKLKNAGHH